MVARRRRNAALLFLLLMLGWLLVACGGSDASQATKTPVASPSPVPGQGQRLLDQAGQKLTAARTLHAIFDMTLNGQLLNGLLNTEVWNMTPDKNRTLVLKSTVAQAQAGALIINNGQQAWQYDPTKKVVYEGKTSSAAPTPSGTPDGDNNGRGQGLFVLGLVKNIFTRSNGTLISSAGQVDGRAVYTIHATPRTAVSSGNNSFTYDGLIYLDKQTLLPVRMDLNIQGFGHVVVDVVNLELNVPLAESLFTFVAPPGTKVLPLSAATPANGGTLTLAQAEQQAGYHLLSIPASHPEYQLQSIDALGAPGNQIYALNYSGNGLTFTVSEGKSLANLPVTGQSLSVRGTTGTLATTADSTTLNWTEKGVGMQVAGKLSKEQIMAIARLLA